MKKREEHEKDNNERWLLTYSDLITLLMIFFVIMYAMSKVDVAKYQVMAQSLSSAMGSGKGVPTRDSDSIGMIDGETDLTSDNTNMNTSKDELIALREEIELYIQEHSLGGEVDVTLDGRGLVLSFQDSILFDSGKADIKTNFKSLLAKLGAMLNKNSFPIRVEGHTDNQPINIYPFTSNWQLSSLRASNVVQLLVDKSKIKKTRIYCIGYGDTKPMADNKTVAGRAKNRRVDIVLESDAMLKNIKGPTIKAPTSKNVAK